MRDRGVSEVISFALVFSLIVATVALVYVSGIGGLESTRTGEQLNNAERAFDVLADNIADIHQEGAPSRATEIKVSDAQMEFGEPTRFNATLRNSFGDNVTVVEYDPIVYSSDGGTDLVYGNGALFREDRSGTVLNREPSLLLSYNSATDRKTVILPVIQTRSAGTESTGSQRTVLVRTLLATREVTIAEDDPGGLSTDPDGDSNDEFTSSQLNPDSVHPNGDADNEYEVTVRLQPPEQRREVWLDYLNELVADQPSAASFDVRDVDGDGSVEDDPACELIDTDSDGTTETVECSLAAEDVYSTVTRVDVYYR